MSEPKRLFFAIDLPDDARTQIIAWRAAHFASEDGRPVAAANLHLTLAFLGDISNDKQRALAQLAGRIRQPPRGLLQLANMLRAQAARSGCYQSPQPFHPHITLLRDASHTVAIPPPGFCWSFPVTSFALYASSYGQGRTRYAELQRWTLGE
ncbi:TPA: 2'-5' RNA ligase family protein [Salmonella enterica]